MATVKRRRYNSSRRQEQARLTRRAILSAAQELFLERGYPGTTVGAIAEQAGVSAETIYKAFRNKAGLVKALFDVAIVGDDEPVPMLERGRVQRMRAEPNPRKKLLLYGKHLSEAGPRAGKIQLLIRTATAVDPEVATVWHQMIKERLIGMTALAQDLDEGKHLRAGISIEDARDILWTYNSVEIYDLLVLQRGWTAERYGRWVAEALIAALLEDEYSSER